MSITGPAMAGYTPWNISLNVCRKSPLLLLSRCRVDDTDWNMTSNPYKTDLSVGGAVSWFVCLTGWLAVCVLCSSVHMCACVRACVRACVCLCLSVSCLSVCLSVCLLPACLPPAVSAHMRMCVCVCARMCVCVCVRARTRMCVCDAQFFQQYPKRSVSHITSLQQCPLCPMCVCVCRCVCGYYHFSQVILVGPVWPHWRPRVGSPPIIAGLRCRPEVCPCIAPRPVRYTLRPEPGSLPQDHPGSGVVAPWLPLGQLHGNSSMSLSSPCRPMCCVCIGAFTAGGARGSEAAPTAYSIWRFPQKGCP